MLIPDFIPEGEEHKWPQLRDKKGYLRDFIPDEPDAFAEPLPEVTMRKKKVPE